MFHQLIALVGVENCSYGFDTLFSYIVPDKLADFLCEGMRVMVPFGNGNSLRQAFVFEINASADEEASKKLKLVHSCLDSKPLLSEEMILLAKWLRERCFCTYFVAAKSVLPGGMCLRTEKIYSCNADILPEIYASLAQDEKLIIDYLRKKKDFVRESRLLKLACLDKGSTLLKRMSSRGLLEESSDAFRRVSDLSVNLVRLSEKFNEDMHLTDKQKSVTDVLLDIGAASVKEIVYFTGVSDSVVKTLVDKGICETFPVTVERDIDLPVSDEKHVKPVLSPVQKEVFDRIFDAYNNDDNKRQALLFGVTGSGKTSVYLELLDKVLADNKNAIVLVPEISLTPQTFSIFSGRYGKDVAVLHSGMSMGERYEEWKRINDGKARVIIGTRSAVFAPVKNIGLIIIDEEQEHTYKSEMAPRYNAKDVARFRCAYNKAFLLLASATPSIETYAKADSGQIRLFELKSRYGNAIIPEVRTVDMTEKRVLTEKFALSDVLADEIADNLNRKEQSILLVNRRGFNTFVVCSDCKNVVTCPKCSISMTYHSANKRLMCHYCGYSIPFVVNCPVCGAENIRYDGSGTQKVEQELKIRFPGAGILRMDADTTTAKNAHANALKAFSEGKYDILIGTQMVAKGLDFPDVTLVGITSADKELYNNDFRSAERTFDLITQVVGRAGRGSRKGRAVIQTVAPDNNIIKIASQQDYKKFYNSEINMRKALIYPPFCDICEIGFSGKEQKKISECAVNLFNKIVSLSENEFSDEKIIILGPMAPRVSKVNEHYRQRILIKCKNSVSFRNMISTALKYIYSEKEFKDISVYADINPEKIN